MLLQVLERVPLPVPVLRVPSLWFMVLHVCIYYRSTVVPATVRTDRFSQQPAALREPRSVA